MKRTMEVSESNNPKLYSNVLIGIPNLGSSSHINAVLQVILHNERLAQIIVQHHSTCLEHKCLVCLILSCMNGLIDGDASALGILSEIAEQWYTINDPFDLLSLVLGKLHHSFISNLGSSDTNMSTPVSDEFAGSFINIGRCHVCQRESTDVTTLFSWQIEVTANITVQEAVHEYLNCQNRKTVNCDICQRPNVNVQEFIDVTLPRFWCIRVLRPPNDASILRKSVTINEELVFTDDTSESKYKFSCGILADGNHFTYIMRCNKSDSLYIFNDATVKKMSYGNLLSSSHIGQRVHTLIYEQVQDVSLISAEHCTPKKKGTGNKEATSTTKNWEVTDISEHDTVLDLGDRRIKSGTFTVHNAPQSGSSLETGRKSKLTSFQDFEDSSIGVDKSIADIPLSSKSQNDESGFVIKKRKRRTTQITSSLPHDAHKKKTSVKVNQKRKNQWRSVTYANGVKTIYVRVMISYELWKQNMNEKDFKYFTSLSKFNFEALYVLLDAEEGIMRLKLSYERPTPKKKTRPVIISSQSRLLLCLLRMRRGTPLRDLAYQFGISKSYAGYIFFGVLRKLCNTFKSMEAAMFSPPEEQQKNRPEAFKPFPEVKVIIDGAEFKIQAPSNYQQQGNTWSKYKHSNTAKYLIGISVFGAVTFVSEGYEGNKTDDEILKACGIMKYLKRGDAVMCDRGYTITGELLEAGIKTFKPPTFGERRRLTPMEQKYNSAITQSRIYVEHAIGKIKEFRILRYVIPLSLRATLNDLVYVAGYLTNFTNRAIRQKKSVNNRK